MADVLSNSISLQSAADAVGSLASETGIAALSDLNYSINAITSTVFYTLVLVIVITTFYRPPMHINSSFFYRNCFRGKQGCCGGSPTSRPWVFTFFAYCVDAMIAAAGIYYIYAQRDPAPGTDTNYYISIEWLFAIFIWLKVLWFECLFNYHHYMPMMALSGVLVFVLFCFSFTLTVLLGVRQFWGSMVLFIAVTIAVFTAVLWNWYICWCFCKKDDNRCGCHRSHYFYTMHAMTCTTSNASSPVATAVTTFQKAPQHTQRPRHY